VVEVVLSVAGNIPKFDRPTEYVSLKQDNLQPDTFYHGDSPPTDSKGTVAIKRLEDRGQ